MPDPNAPSVKELFAAPEFRALPAYDPHAPMDKVRLLSRVDDHFKSFSLQDQVAAIQEMLHPGATDEPLNPLFGEKVESIFPVAHGIRQIQDAWANRGNASAAHTGHEIFGGLTKTLSPFAIPAAYLAPLATGVGAVGSMGGSNVGRSTVQALGGGKDAQDIGEDVGGLAGGTIGGLAGDAAQPYAGQVAKVVMHPKTTVMSRIPQITEGYQTGGFTGALKGLFGPKTTLKPAPAAPVDPLQGSTLHYQSQPGRYLPQSEAAAAPAPAAPPSQPVNMPLNQPITPIEVPFGTAPIQPVGTVPFNESLLPSHDWTFEEARNAARLLHKHGVNPADMTDPFHWNIVQPVIQKSVGAHLTTPNPYTHNMIIQEWNKIDRAPSKLEGAVKNIGGAATPTPGPGQ